jgi:hypothetical protein
MTVLWRSRRIPVTEMRRKLLRRLRYLAALWAMGPFWRYRRPAARHGLPGQLVMSLTSYPARYGTLALTLRSLLSQDVAADRVVLNLAETDIAALPSAVRRLEAYGLEIRGTTDTRSYKKIIPALRNFPEAFIVTADDDVYYPSDWLSRLIAGWDGRPNLIVCHRARELRRDDDGRLMPYGAWPLKTAAGGESRELVPTGVGGVLYPPRLFNEEVLDEEAFMRLCPTGDDLWLYWIGRRSGANYRRVHGLPEPANWPATRRNALHKHNLSGGANDRMIEALLAEYGDPLDYP